jgi:DNA polymerase-3 subunit beta
MKFNISSDKLKKIISLASRVCGTNLTLPILNNILLELENKYLKVFSTNLEIGILAKIPVDTEEQSGKISIPGKVFSDFINSLPNKDVQVSVENFIMNVKCGDYNAKILGQDPKDFPVLPEINEQQITAINSNNLISSLSKVYHIVSPIDTRVEISGILMSFKKDKLLLCGTDSIRLSEKTINLNNETKETTAIIPQRTISEVIHIFSGLEGEVGITLDKSQVSFNFLPKDKTDIQVSLVSRLIEGNFPDYKEIIPKQIKTECIFDKSELQNKIKTASLFSSKIQDVKLKFDPKNGKIFISSSSSDIGETQTSLKGKMKGEEMEITFNWKFLLDGLAVINSSEVFFGVNDAMSPTILQPIGDKSYFYILMPKTV